MIEGEDEKIVSPTCSFDEEQNENEHVIENNVGFMEPSPSIFTNIYDLGQWKIQVLNSRKRLNQI